MENNGFIPKWIVRNLTNTGICLMSATMYDDFKNEINLLAAGLKKSVNVRKSSSTKGVVVEWK